MNRFIKKIANKVLNKAIKITQAPEPIKTDKFEQLKQNGSLIIGDDCLIDSGFNIFSHKYSDNFNHVIIGNDCHLMGTIELYSENAQVKIGDRVFIGPNTKLFCYESITIESDVMISWGCTLIDTNAHSLLSSERKDDVINWKKGHIYKNWMVVKSLPIVVKAKSWIGFNAIITKGVTIEEGTVVGSGSVVTKSTEKFTIVGGNPAVFIKKTE